MPNASTGISPPRLKPRSLSHALLFWTLVLALLFVIPHAHAQGCAQCLDSTRATPPAVQAAYRHAILLLGGSAITIFLGGIFLLRRSRS